MRYRLRTLLILMAIGPPVIALTWWYGKATIGFLLLVIVFAPGLLMDVFGAIVWLISRQSEDETHKKDSQ